MASLRIARTQFSACLAQLILWINEYDGWAYEVAIDEVTDRITEKDPTTDHMKGSTHEIGLGADLLLYKNGVYLDKSEDYMFAGEKWEQMGAERHLPLVWGGRFSKPDGNHFSHKWGNAS